MHFVARRFFSLNPQYALKCGLEVHTQLKTKYKLFSLSPTSFDAPPNTNVSYFDCGLPGTQPKLNPEALLLALKTAVALGCDVLSKSSFDRKHYFYPDQPLGYQITQHYHPIARNGQLVLKKHLDSIAQQEKTIRIEQIQLEQDTGKTTYDKFDQQTKIDLNRANIPLIELVTKPDFDSPEQVKAFLRKYWMLVTHLDICTGNLETGAMRVDVNVSVNGGDRVEIKNLGSTGEIMDAMEFEYNRQISLLQAGEKVAQETRGWNGKETQRRRSKEDAVDYRYFPDPELPVINLSASIGDEIRASLPLLPDEVISSLMSEPYNLELKHAKFLVENKEILDYYYETVKSFASKGLVRKVNNWILHELLGAFNKLGLPVDLSVVPAEKLSSLISLVVNGDISSTSAKLLLQNMVKSPSDALVSALVEEFDLGRPKDVSQDDLELAIEEICREIMDQNPDVVEKIHNGRKKSLNFLIGLAMKETQGKVTSQEFANKFNQLISQK